MRYFKTALLALVFIFLCVSAGSAKGPKGKDFGFGLILGDPSGGTIKYWTNNENAFDFYIGSSYFGNIRIGGDYLWHFDAFNSRAVKMYAGLGLAVGIGNGQGLWYKEDKHKFYYWEDDELGFGARGIFGINFIPRNTPLEIFFELGPMMGISPNYGVNMDAAIGIRFYP
ncbi:MAG: hypothetical protein PF588_10230 [Candidatus Kapabacteria bacterium]|jgi:hypothetical protein|nr:hypothetical protein [Candidatus Kapabacteria bacterium]